MVVYTTDQSKRQKLDSLSPPPVNRDASIEQTPEFHCDLSVEPFGTQQEKNEHSKTCCPWRPKKTAKDADGNFQCSECPKKFDKHRRLTSHMQTVHRPKDADTRFACPMCPRWFDTKRKRLSHVNGSHGQPYKCLYAECVNRKPYTSQSGLGEHTRRYHLRIGRVPCLVESCEGNTTSTDGLYSTQSGLDNHTKLKHR